MAPVPAFVPFPRPPFLLDSVVLTRKVNWEHSTESVPDLRHMIGSKPTLRAYPEIFSPAFRGRTTLREARDFGMSETGSGFLRSGG